MIFVWSLVTHWCSYIANLPREVFRDIVQLKATFHTRMRAPDHCTSSTLIGGKGVARPSSLHTKLEGHRQNTIKWFLDQPSYHRQTKTCLVKFIIGQYMGHAWKKLIFGRNTYPSHACPICNSSEAYTWLHVLLKCKQQHIHALITNKHNIAIWEVRKLLVSNNITMHYILMNACIYNDSPQENTLPTWLLPCTCDTQRCQCNARLKPDILCVIGHPYNSPPRAAPTPEITIQFKEFTYCNDMFSTETRERKITKHQPLINNLIAT
jgi:hypothetical protein